MTRVIATVAIVASCMLAAAASPQTDTAFARAACGSDFWPLKTFSDPQRELVTLRPSATTIAAINALPQPVPTPATRSTLYERHVWRVRAQIVRFRLEADDDIHVILFAGGSYMLAEMPAAACLPAATRDRPAIVAARDRFISRCGVPLARWQSLGAVATISGVGFWDFAHGQAGHARNYAELHPVTALRVTTGC